MAQWRVAKAKGITLVDITAKSGDEFFSPDWSAVDRYKKSKKTVDDIAVYIVRYYEKLNRGMKDNEEHFKKFLEMEEVAVACYCNQNDKDYCHTQTFVEACEKLCKRYKIPFKYMGIVKK